MHKHLVSLLNLSIGLSMVRWSPNLPHAHELTQLFDDITLKIGALITQELGQGSKDQDIFLPQKFSNSLCSLVRGHLSHDVFCKVITENQNGHHIWWLILLHSHLNACEVYVWQLQRSIGNDGLQYWYFGTSALCWMHCLQLLITFCICLAILGYQNQSCSRYSVHCWPWCPASWWHLFIAATQWAMGTMNHITSSSLPAGVWWW